jgi:hypothetical protein
MASTSRRFKVSSLIRRAHPYQDPSNNHHSEAKQHYLGEPNDCNDSRMARQGISSGGPYLALKLVGECGTDVSAWPGHRTFLLDPHSKMPNMNLTRMEAGDIAAYIHRLQ